ncbi:hypothetical protein Ciccas_008618 [Cichlidogyrus casuarinus]|uniref:Uncharacterized protein n=1 Tax=Cichlidogyrus casuarinus TaxID=1844966 RepID=A0ABD2Q0R9_9PLAT
MKPKVQDVMEFPTLETAAKEENVKVKPEPENQNAWKTVSVRNETDSYQPGGYRPRVYEDKGGSFNRRRKDNQPELEGDWTRGKTINSSQPMRRDVDNLDASGFVRGGPKTMQDRPARFSERTFSPKGPRNSVPDDSNGWTRGNVIQSSQVNNAFQRNDDPIDMRQEAQANEYSMRHKNRFEALSELN